MCGFTTCSNALALIGHFALGLGLSGLRLESLVSGVECLFAPAGLIIPGLPKGSPVAGFSSALAAM